MAEDQMLEKTNRINLLFDFYQSLLTDKQRTYMKHYFHDDYSLGEIAAEFEISRQAIYEHIKRAENVLEDYEQKLRLLALHEQRAKTLGQLKDTVAQLSAVQRGMLEPLIQQLKDLE
jgi:predicted DNA-binding protein YlxM (UPF0122 family)